MKGMLPIDIYYHFLSFSLAISIIVSPSLCQIHPDEPHHLLEYFVSKASELNCHEFYIDNVHCLLHFTPFVRHLGCLDSFSITDRSVLENFSRTGKAPSTKKALPENVINLVKCMLLLLLLSRFYLFYKQCIDSVSYFVLLWLFKSTFSVI